MSIQRSQDEEGTRCMRRAVSGARVQGASGKGCTLALMMRESAGVNGESLLLFAELRAGVKFFQKIHFFICRTFWAQFLPVCLETKFVRPAQSRRRG